MKVLFHKVNTPSTYTLVMAKIKELTFELLPHPPHTSDLAPSDFCLFPNLKKWLSGKRVLDDSQLSDDVNGYFEELKKSTYVSGITAVECLWKSVSS